MALFFYLVISKASYLFLIKYLIFFLKVLFFIFEKKI